MPASTTIRLEGALNFRDIGGHGTQNNLWLKRGLLFRAGELTKLTKSDIGELRRLGIKTILDFRTPNERKSKPDKFSGFTCINIPLYPTSGDPGGLRRFLSLFDKKIDYEVVVREFYDRVAFGHTARIRRIIDILSVEAHLPALIHCTGGKDRTGILSAFIQLFAGVSMNDVLADYLLTNDYLEPFVRKIFRKSRWLTLFRVSIERMRPLLVARREYLEEMLDRLFREYGTIENYFATGCGIDRETLSRLRAVLLAEQGG